MKNLLKILSVFLLLAAIQPLSFSQNIKNIAQANQGSSDPNDIFAVAQQGNILWVGTWGGLFKFDKTTGVATQINNLPYQDINSLAIDKNGTLWVGFSDFAGVSSFDGTTWTNYNSQNSGLPENSVWSIAVDSNNVKWFGTWGGLAKFDGTNWTVYSVANSGISNDIIYSLAIDKNNAVWAGTNHGISKFDGSSWTNYNSSNSDYQGFVNLSLTIDKNGNIWAGTEYKGIYKFDGTGWTNYTKNLTGLDYYGDGIASIFSDPSGNIWATNSSAIIKYDGTNWEYWNGSDTVGVSGYPYRVVFLDDSSNVWTGSNGLVEFTGNSFLRYNLSIIAGIDNNENIPGTYFISQNYPNPFNPSTEIEYQIPKESFVVIKIYDSIGREVRTLVNKDKPAGNYRVTFNATSLSSGVYFYRITAGSYTSVKKMILMK